MESATEETSKETTENVVPDKNDDVQVPTPAQVQDPPKKSKRDDRNKKDEKNVEQFMKSLNSVPTLEEKLSLVCKKYVQLTDDNKKMQFYIKQSDKRYGLLLKEKEQLQHEFNKTVLVKSKLESLCRELQKQNKAIKEESLLKIREEEERRKETQAKFQNTLTEITTLLQQNNEKNAKLRDDNISMSEKFKSVVQQYQLREQQVDKMAKQMELESQLSDAKLQKASLEHQAERERLTAEIEQFKVTVAQCRAKIMELQGTETALKGQLAIYTDKYDEFQNALVKSNQMFGGFKEQMDKMSKKIKKLESESMSWKKRWECSQAALVEACAERAAADERAAAAARATHHLHGLCRTLQAERGALVSTLKEHNIERPPVPAVAPAEPPPLPAPAPAPATQNNAKVDAMAANCAQLRQSLAHLQNQLNVLTNKNDAKAEPPKAEKPEKQKKSKSKKNKDKKTKESVQEKSSSQKEIAIDESNVTDIEKSNVPCEYDNNVKVETETTTSGENTDKAENTVAVANGNKEEAEVNDSPVESTEDKVDDTAIENLLEAISNANISICNLEVGNDRETLENGAGLDLVEEVLKEVANDMEQVQPIDVKISNKECPNAELSHIEEVKAIVAELN